MLDDIADLTLQAARAMISGTVAVSTPRCAAAASPSGFLSFLVSAGRYRYTGDGEPKVALDEFEKTGRMDWVTDLADIPRKYGVANVYADIGASFAACCVTEPHTAAAIMGILLKGMGKDHIIWGTDEA